MSLNLESQLNSLPPAKRKLMERALAGDRLARLYFRPDLAMGGKADRWQVEALKHLVPYQSNVLMCCSRGAGKTEVFSCSAYLEACCLGGFAMILSRSDRQAQRIIVRAMEYHRRLGLVSTVTQNMHELRFANGGRILALPCSGDTIVGEHGVTLLGLDEAARIKDAFYAMVEPMLLVSERVTGIKARRALLSTPYGQRGFFYREWTANETGLGRQDWVRYRMTWRDCPRISPQDVDDYRRSHDENWIKQELETEFLGEGHCYFDLEAMQGCVDHEMENVSY